MPGKSTFYNLAVAEILLQKTLHLDGDIRIFPDYNFSCRVNLVLNHYSETGFNQYGHSLTRVKVVWSYTAGLITAFPI